MSTLQSLLQSEYFNSICLVSVSLITGWVLRGIFQQPQQHESLESPSSDATTAAQPVSNEENKMVLVVRTDLGMGKGKIAAQCSHAAVGCCEKALKKQSPYLRIWRSHGQAKIVLKCNSEEELFELAARAEEAGLTNVVIRDAGRTQIASGSATVLGIGPGPRTAIDAITKHLKLM